MPARSIKQQRLFGMVHAAQQGQLKDPPPQVARIADSIAPDEAAEAYAKTKHRGIRERVENGNGKKTAGLTLPRGGFWGSTGAVSSLLAPRENGQKVDILTRFALAKRAADAPQIAKIASVIGDEPATEAKNPEHGVKESDTPATVVSLSEVQLPQRVALQKFAKAVVSRACPPFSRAREGVIFARRAPRSALTCGGRKGPFLRRGRGTASKQESWLSPGMSATFPFCLLACSGG